MDYEVLKVIWWVLIGVLLIGFAIADGFDMGAGILMPFVGKKDTERRIAINALGPHWDGNQVWFITAGGAIFAAWPVVYSVAFSGFYWAMLLVLFALFFRPVGFEYRSKVKDSRWRTAWDWGIFAGSFVPALVFGVAFGNLFQGVPFKLDSLMYSNYTGNFFQLLNPFAILCGVVSVAMLVLQGGNYLHLRTTGDVAERARKYSAIGGVVAVVAFILAGVWLKAGIDGFVLTKMGDPNAALDVLHKTVEVKPGAWFNNYAAVPALWIAPLLGVVGTLLSVLVGLKGRAGIAFILSSLAIAGIIFTAGGSLFPFVMPSSIDPASSLTMWDVVSSHKTLGIMFVAACIFVPLILIYTSWCYYKMWGKVTEEHIEKNPVGSY